MTPHVFGNPVTNSRGAIPSEVQPILTLGNTDETTGQADIIFRKLVRLITATPVSENQKSHPVTGHTSDWACLLPICVTAGDSCSHVMLMTHVW